MRKTCGTTGGVRRLAVALVCSLPSLASAQRREGETQIPVLKVELKTPCKFGGLVVEPRLYVVSVLAGKLVLTDPQSRVVVATLAASESANTVSVDPPTVEVREQGNKVTLVLKHLDEVYTVVGEKTQALAPAKGPDTVLAKREALLQTSAPPEEKSELEVIQQALKRYGKDVLHCAERAVRSGWQTDDERYEKCVCPLSLKWRLPKPKAALRVDYVLLKERAGMSLTVQPDGKSAGCRVWIGREPPPAKAPEAAAAAAPPPSVAPSPNPPAARGPEEKP